jgi:hypothetical protein
MLANIIKPADFLNYQTLTSKQKSSCSSNNQKEYYYNAIPRLLL